MTYNDMPRRLPRQRRSSRALVPLAFLAVVVVIVGGIYWNDSRDLHQWESACRSEGGAPQKIIRMDYDYYRKAWVDRWVCTGPTGMVISRHTSYSY